MRYVRAPHSSSFLFFNNILKRTTQALVRFKSLVDVMDLGLNQFKLSVSGRYLKPVRITKLQSWITVKRNSP